VNVLNSCIRLRTVLGGQAKRGILYLRTLFVAGLQALLQRPQHWDGHGFGRWLQATRERLHRNMLAAALANKLACIAWGVLSRERRYDAELASRMA
jgi:transposase